MKGRTVIIHTHKRKYVPIHAVCVISMIVIGVYVFHMDDKHQMCIINILVYNVQCESFTIIFINTLYICSKIFINISATFYKIF